MKMSLKKDHGARQLKQIPVIFSTYHSCFKLSEINFNTVINDEAHFLSQENFHDNYLALNAINSYCFTATEKHTFSSNGRGLNNTSKYGRLLSTTQPVELIEKGYITGVKLHIENFTTDNREKTYISEITEALDKNIRLSSKLPQYKIVVSTPGTKYIKMIEDNIEKLKKYGCPIFTISSKNKSRINNVVVPREEFLTKIKEAENAIVFHYDILSEGIDVDGITGVIINRNMSKSKALQTIGRAVRIYKAQPELKPYAWITVTCPNDDDDIKDFFKELIDEFVEEGYDPKDVYDEKIVKEHLKEEENVEDAYGADRKLTSNTDADDIAHYVYDRKQEVELEKFKSVDINNAEAAIKAVNNYFKEMSSYEN
jgi:superfamily II DNA or RNA helicase